MVLGALATASLLASVGPAQAQAGPASCSVTGQNLYVRDVMRDLYLWNEFLPGVNPTSYPSPEAYLEAVRYRPLDAELRHDILRRGAGVAMEN